MVNHYTSLLRSGEIQLAYKGILVFMGKLRSDFSSKYPGYEIGGGIYQGYMDMSYFSLNTQMLKKRGLKIAVVYLHEKNAFEAWLSARNREILEQYREIFNDVIIDEVEVFHDETNEDAVIECLLTDSPDFDNQDPLMDIIERGTVNFINAVEKILENVLHSDP
jgi:hypothetical protein